VVIRRRAIWPADEHDEEAAMADHVEIEAKFDVEAGFAVPDFSTVPGCTGISEPVTHHLSATYYDTHDQRLAASKITLRRRTGGPDEGWHLKLPAGGYARRELQEPLRAGDEGHVPDRLASQVDQVAAGLPLAPIASLHTERTVRTLLGSPHVVLAEVADDLVTAWRTAGPGGDGTASEPLRWREVEVEVPEGTAPEVLHAAAKLLLAAGARPAGKGSKLARLLDS
jgi:inorganic triphosphatase YgiF